MQEDLFEPHHVNPWAKIIGFTGSIGSGCSMIAKYLEKHKGYKRFALSSILRREAKIRGLGDNPTTEQLQNLGNELRQKNDNDYLVKETLKIVNEQKITDKIIIDSIKNTGEVYHLRKYANFYLIALYARREIRKMRTKDKYKGREDQFIRDDERDSEETFEYGQQVRSCVYLADILIQNDADFYNNSTEETNFYRDKIDYHFDLIENPGTKYPFTEETIMTLAYTQSIRSSCLKRKVGAIITTRSDQIIAAGYNDPPQSEPKCKYKYGMCFRDRIRLEFIQKFKFCPECGRKIHIEYPCPKCGQVIKQFELKCPNKDDCGIDLDIPVVCQDKQCGFDIGKEFKMKELGRCRALHAEETAIISFPKVGGGVSLKDSKIFTTTFPCNMCANRIVSTGISSVVYVEPYPDPDSRGILENNGVNVKLFEGVKSRAYFRLFGNL